jgi:hypothetical protein
MARALKQYGKTFLVEDTKLRSIVEMMHKRLAMHAGLSASDSFDVFIKGERQEQLDSLEDVLSLDNSRRQRIERLIVTASASQPNGQRPTHEIQVDFAGPKPGTSTRVVTIEVKSDSPAWASSTLALVEEQVERTWVNHALPITLLALGVVLGIILLVAQFVYLGLPVRADSLWLTQENANHLEAMLANGRTLNDQEIREITSWQFRNVLGLDHQPRSSKDGNPWRVVFQVVPIILGVGCCIYLIFTYQAATFLWGDEKDRHARRENIRKGLWAAIIATFLTGMLSKFAFEG